MKAKRKPGRRTRFASTIGAVEEAALSPNLTRAQYCQVAATLVVARELRECSLALARLLDRVLKPSGVGDEDAARIDAIVEIARGYLASRGAP